MSNADFNIPQMGNISGKKASDSSSLPDFKIVIPALDKAKGQSSGKDTFSKPPTLFDIPLNPDALRELGHAFGGARLESYDNGGPPNEREKFFSDLLTGLQRGFQNKDRLLEYCAQSVVGNLNNVVSCLQGTTDRDNNNNPSWATIMEADPNSPVAKMNFDAPKNGDVIQSPVQPKAPVPPVQPASPAPSKAQLKKEKKKEQQAKKEAERLAGLNQVQQTLSTTLPPVNGARTPPRSGTMSPFIPIQPSAPTLAFQKPKVGDVLASLDAFFCNKERAVGNNLAAEIGYQGTVILEHLAKAWALWKVSHP
jgi:hypothetical protein